MRKRAGKIGTFALSMTMAVSMIAGCDKKGGDPTGEPTKATLATTEAETEATKPATEADTTVAVSTEAVTTEAVTTAEATTEEPVTEAPTTEEATEEAPTLDPDMAPAEAFSALEQEILEYRIGNNYYQAVTKIGHPEDFGFTPEKLTDYRITIYDRNEAKRKDKIEKRLKAKLDLIDREALNDAQKLTYDKLQYEFKVDADLRAQADLSSPIDHERGLFRFVDKLYDFPFYGEDELTGYQKILEALPATLQEAIDFMQYQKDEYSYYPVTSRVREAAENAIALAGDKDNPLLDNYEEKVRAMDIPEETKEEYIRKNREYVTGPLKDAMLKFSRDVQKFNSSSNKTQGLCKYEGGAEYYQAYLNKILGAEMTPQELFEYLDYKLRLDTQRYFLFVERFPEDYEAFQDDSFETPYDKTSVEEITAFFTKAMAQDFPMELLPAYEVYELPELMWTDYNNAYYVKPAWGSDKARIIRYNPYYYGAYETEIVDEDLVREGIGGVMLQDACAAGNSIATSFYVNDAYTNGWGIYAQFQIGKYAGLSDAINEFRNNNSLYNSDIYAISDVAVNGLGWSLENLQDYMEMFMDRYDVEKLYDRAIANPGREITRSFGSRKTQDLIEAYKKAHPDDLDLKEMHRKYMSIGPTSFELIEKYFLEK